MVAPDGAVGAEAGAEGPELEPARVQFAAFRYRMVEAANIRAPIGNAGHPGVQPQGNLRFEGGEGIVDIARPTAGAILLHARRARPAEQERSPLRVVAALALRECLLA